MNNTMKILLSVVVSLIFLVGMIALASGLIILLFGVWGIALPFFRVFYSVILIAMIRAILFGTDNKK